MQCFYKLIPIIYLLSNDYYKSHITIFDHISEKRLEFVSGRLIYTGYLNSCRVEHSP